MTIGSNYIYFKELTSTNSQASLILKEGLAAHGCIIYTDYQTSGRGTAGNKWESERGKNLLISIILSPKFILPEDQFYISMAISLGICEFADIYLLRSKIKWPNDIYVNNDKIAGILIENSILGGTIESTIAGIGININQISFPSSVPNPVSFSMLTGREYDRKVCLEELLACVDRSYETLKSGKLEDIRKEYLSRLYWLNEWHFYRSGGKQFRGKIKGISVFGRLIIEDENARLAEFDFKEVEYVR
jgi:BirA family transcriptional regulator, biotin operon repressor / biotin---[acetyl-CoA-carboxylase] ligase